MTRDIKKNILDGIETATGIGNCVGGYIFGVVGGLLVAIKECLILTRLIWFSIATSISLVAILWIAKLLIDSLGIVTVGIIFASIAAGGATVFTIIRESQPRYPHGKRKSSNKKKTHHEEEVVDSEGKKTTHRNNH